MAVKSLRSLAVPLALVALALLVAACLPGAGPSGSPGGSPGPTSTPAGAVPLTPATPSDPFSLLAWLFTPIFQTLFIALVLIDKAVGNIAVAIVVLTVVLRLALIPLFRRQTVSTRRMQLLGPEVKEIQRRYKGDRVKANDAVQQLYRERGVNPLSGCLPIMLQMFLLIPMYTVFTQGLQNFNPQSMLDVFGFRILDLGCDPAPIIVNGHVTNPCLNPIAFGVDWSKPEVLFSVAGFGVSLLGLFAGLLTYVQSRMTLPPPDAVDPSDPNVRVQRQMAIIFPFIYVFLGASWPSGLLLYIMVSTIVGIVQQYLIIGWGGMFPLFGWHPAFAQDHSPRFPVAHPQPPDPSKRPPAQPRGPTNRSASAEKTIRPRERGRQGRRGRRR